MCSSIHMVARSDSCWNVMLQSCGKLQGAISYFLATRSSQMNVKMASDTLPLPLPLGEGEADPQLSPVPRQVLFSGHL